MHQHTLPQNSGRKPKPFALETTTPEMITGGGHGGEQAPAYYQNGARGLPYDARKASGAKRETRSAYAWPLLQSRTTLRHCPCLAAGLARTPPRVPGVLLAARATAYASHSPSYAYTACNLKQRLRNSCTYAIMLPLQVDTWALGVLLYVLVAAQYPFSVRGTKFLVPRSWY